MAAYRRVYDSHHLQADCQEPRSARNPTLGNRVWAIFAFLPCDDKLAQTVAVMQGYAGSTLNLGSLKDI